MVPFEKVTDGRTMELRYHELSLPQDLCMTVVCQVMVRSRSPTTCRTLLRPPPRDGPDGGRLIGYLAVCDPREGSISELADALLASRSAIAGAVNALENLDSSGAPGLRASVWTGYASTCRRLTRWALTSPSSAPAPPC
jgi:hypothetical protein